MQFNIDQDTGPLVSGWLSPDNPTEVPTFEILRSNEHVLAFTANIQRDDIVRLNLHKTGLVGFVLTSQMLPGLEECDDLQIRQAVTGIPIHNRVRGLPFKLFHVRLCSLHRDSIDAQIGKYFSLGYRDAEQYPYETLHAILNNKMAQSIYGGGRPYFMRHRDVLRTNNFRTICLLRDPHEELAIQLLRQPPSATLADLNEPPHHDATPDFSIDAILKHLSPDQAAALSNPFLKCLACMPGEEPSREHIPIALDNLADMDVVGAHDTFEDVRAIAAESFGSDLFGNIHFGDASHIKDYAAHLRRHKVAQKLLRLDVELYDLVLGALAAANSRA